MTGSVKLAYVRVVSDQRRRHLALPIPICISVAIEQKMFQYLLITPESSILCRSVVLLTCMVMCTEVAEDRLYAFAHQIWTRRVITIKNPYYYLSLVLKTLTGVRRLNTIKNTRSTT